MTTSPRRDPIQRVRIGATKEGKITAIAHEIASRRSAGRDFFEPVAHSARSRSMQARAALDAQRRAARPAVAGAVRAPGEAMGMLALEAAIDEMAERSASIRSSSASMNEPEQAIP